MCARVEIGKLPQAKISGEWSWWEGHRGQSRAISAGSEVVFSDPVRSAKLALISPRRGRRVSRGGKGPGGGEGLWSVSVELI